MRRDKGYAVKKVALQPCNFMFIATMRCFKPELSLVPPGLLSELDRRNYAEVYRVCVGGGVFVSQCLAASVGLLTYI